MADAEKLTINSVKKTKEKKREIGLISRKPCGL